MKRIITTAILFFIISGWAQADTTDYFTKQQMYEDFDQFVNIVQTYNPQVPIRKMATNYDMIAKIQSRRSDIENISERYEFYEFMNEMLGHLIDMHAYMFKYNSLNNFYYQRAVNEIDTINLRKHVAGHLKYLSKKKNSFSTFGNFCCYYNGHYYIRDNVRLSGKDVGPIILNKHELIKAGDTPINIYIEDNLQKLRGVNVRWDYKNQCYYGTLFTFPQPIILTFLDLQTGKEIQIDMAKYVGFEFGYRYSNKGKAKIDINPSVSYFKKEKILYIYLPSMMQGTQDKLLPEISKIGKKYPLEKVVFDVRGNRGGSDYVWMDIIKRLVPDTIKWDCNMVIREPLAEAFRREDTDNDTPYSPCQFLGEKYLSVGTEDKYIPDPNNLGFKGQFYVFQNLDTYSAAHSLSSICRYSDRFTSIGIPTGLLSGRGTGPFAYQLKNSYFTFAMESDLDITYAKTAIDCYQDIPEIVLDLSFEETYKNPVTVESKAQKYLRNKDPYFKKVLELK